ncbi:Xylanolytic transcriptional activator xlnR [Fusarium austroafricanum]|uniref:Xylanolytic transcriptional activator xlnR n=1 Tax=Fusarium austroafricanum TaxID=2364996 RepID=A0A8H4KIN9_9HYPO|nr:Xylanolytic transcriptional activator xlnR [Fusarium austroafricanum]
MEKDRWGYSKLHRSGLRLSGPENQDVRLLIRMTRWRFTAINDSGLPFLSELCAIAQKYSSVRSAMLALAGSLRPWIALNAVTSGSAQSPSQRHQAVDLASSALERYQSALQDLQIKISELHVSEANNDDIVELLGSVLILITAGFPSDSRPSQDADWTLHISGIVSLIESLDQNHIQSVYISRLAREIAAYLDIGIFSLGSLGQSRSRRAWLSWNIEPPGAPQQTDFSPMEVMLGYPRSLVTVIASMAALLECKDRGEIDSLVQTTIAGLFEQARQGRDDASPPVEQQQREKQATIEELCTQLETTLTLWTQPVIPSRISIPVRLALTTAWEIMRKAALIYLWRGGFGANVQEQIPSVRANIASKFIREMILSLQALLHMYDEQRITIMNIMTWPTVVIAISFLTDSAGR